MLILLFEGKHKTPTSMNQRAFVMWCEHISSIFCCWNSETKYFHLFLFLVRLSMKSRTSSGSADNYIHSQLKFLLQCLFEMPFALILNINQYIRIEHLSRTSIDYRSIYTSARNELPIALINLWPLCSQLT